MPLREDHRNYVHRRIAQTIDEYTRTFGYPPTLRDIGVRIGLTSSSVYRWVRIMEAGGLVLRDGETARSLRLTDAGRSVR